MSEPKAPPEVGRELFGPDLQKIWESKIPTVVVCKKDKHPAYATMGLYAVMADAVVFRLQPTPKDVVYIVCALLDGKVYDRSNLQDQVHVYEWVNPDAPKPN